MTERVYESVIRTALGLFRVLDFQFEIDGVEIAALFGEISVLVENVSYAATHAGGKISSASSKDDDQAPGHVFATMVTYAFDDRGGSRVANRKALARDSVEKCFATGRTVESDVADQNILFGGEG